MLRDITTLEDITILVSHFYDNARKDELLGTIFNNAIEDRWPQHLEKMVSFWQTVLLEDHTYSGRPFLPHANLNIDANHFERWIQLFNQTIDTYFEGINANRAKWQGQRMAQTFQYTLEYHRTRVNYQ